jgi:hypothetical protein
MPDLTISGSTGLAGVAMNGLPGYPVSDENGSYSSTVPYGWSGVARPRKAGYRFDPPAMEYTPVTHDLNRQNYSPRRVGPTPMLGGTGGRKVLVIPAADVKVEDLGAITQDLHVMSHIFDERFKETRETGGVFPDFGDFFGRDSRGTEAMYLQGYGALFLMEVNFAFSPPPKLQEQEAQRTEEYVDRTWQRAREKIFSPRDPTLGTAGFSEQESGLVKVEELRTELVKTLKHAANIRDLKPDEWVILTVIGQARQPSQMYGYKYFGRTVPAARSRTSGYGRSSSSGGGGFGGGMGGFGAGGSSSTGGGMAGGMYGGMGSMTGGMYGTMGTYPGTISPSSTVLTIRARKSDVDDFAKGELNLEQFREKVQIFTY